MEALFSEANLLFVEERYEEASAAYESAISAAAGSPPKTLARLYAAAAACSSRLADNSKALERAAKSVELDEHAVAAWNQLGKAQLQSKHFDEAKTSLAKAASLADGLVGAQRLKASISELLATIPISTSKTTASASSKPAANDSIAAPAPTSVATAATKKPKFEWYQTLNDITVTYFAKGADEKKSAVSVRPRTLHVDFGLFDGAEFIQELELHDEVQPGLMSAIYRPSKVEIKVFKSDTSKYMWPTLERTGASAPLKPLAPTVPPVAAPTAKPPTAYASKKDWRAIEKDIEEELEADKPEGEAALQKLFQQIYASGDEETRKAMNKSFQMSGGTVLSTNWKDVQVRDFEKEKVAPPGQDIKKFEY